MFDVHTELHAPFQKTGLESKMLIDDDQTNQHPLDSTSHKLPITYVERH